MLDEQQQVAEAPEADSPYTTVLKTWARWMKLADHQVSNGWAHPQDVKEFMACGEAVEAMINDLSLMHWCAVRKAWGFSTLWRWPEDVHATALAEAEKILMPKLLRNVATRRYFH